MKIDLSTVEAGARQLFKEGVHHGWWPHPKTYDALDPIGKDEFDAIVERVVMASRSAEINWDEEDAYNRRNPVL